VHGLPDLLEILGIISARDGEAAALVQVLVILGITADSEQVCRLMRRDVG
jgi:hypothetical protein